VFVGAVLLIGWVVCLRLTLRSIGGLGLLLANAFLAALYWLVASWGWLPIENVADLMARPVQRRRHPGRRHVVVPLAPEPGRPIRLTTPTPSSIVQPASAGFDLSETR
jgi:hypothetical protein